MGVDMGYPGENGTVVAQDGVLLSFMKVTSTSQAAVSSSEVVLHLSSVKRGADICDKCDPESCNFGKGTRGVSGLAGAGCKAGTGVSRILTC